MALASGGTLARMSFAAHHFTTTPALPGVNA